MSAYRIRDPNETITPFTFQVNPHKTRSHLKRKMCYVLMGLVAATGVTAGSILGFQCYQKRQDLVNLKSQPPDIPVQNLGAVGPVVRPRKHVATNDNKQPPPPSTVDQIIQNIKQNKGKLAMAAGVALGTTVLRHFRPNKRDRGDKRRIDEDLNVDDDDEEWQTLQRVPMKTIPPDPISGST